MTAIPGETPLPYISGESLMWLTWSEGEGTDPISRGSVRLDSIVAYHTSGENEKSPRLHLHLASGAEFVIAIEEPDDAWQGFMDFTEQLDRGLMGKGWK